MGYENHDFFTDKPISLYLRNDTRQVIVTMEDE